MVFSRRLVVLDACVGDFLASLSYDWHLISIHFEYCLSRTMFVLYYCGLVRCFYTEFINVTLVLNDRLNSIKMQHAIN